MERGEHVEQGAAHTHKETVVAGPRHTTSEHPHHLCPAEHSSWLVTPLRKLGHNPGRILKGLVKEGDTAIDVGCGPGFFSLPLARMVGKTGRVIAVDVQQEMLTKLSIRAEKAGLASRIELHLANPESLGALPPADFALAFYMLHEVTNRDMFLQEVHDLLKAGGRFLLVEPRGEVSRAEYGFSVVAAGKAGFVPISAPRVAFSRATLFGRR
jgi:SAM-dependent methyltransferase